jgi:hypothetical protein
MMLTVKKDWGVLLSRTGTEVVDISLSLGFLPSLVVTNNLSKLHPGNLNLLRDNNVSVEVIPFRPELKNYTGVMSKYPNIKLLTLHGYLRILPEEFCDFVKRRGIRAYNGHPALISKYSDLKGFNMQEAIVGKQEKYPSIGSVVHEVSPVLDSGQIVTTCEIPNIARNQEHAYSLLRKTSFEAWIYFFKSFWNIAD